MPKDLNTPCSIISGLYKKGHRHATSWTFKSLLPGQKAGNHECRQDQLDDGACAAHYAMVSKIQWKSFWLGTQLYAQNDWHGLGGIAVRTM